MDANVRVDAAEVRLDRLLLDPESLRDELVAVSPLQQAQDVVLASTEHDLGGGGADVPDQVSGHARIEGRIASTRGEDACDQLLGLGVLEQVPGSAEADGLDDVIGVRACG